MDREPLDISMPPTQAPSPSLAEVIRRFGPSYRADATRASRAQRRAMNAIERCRTPALGGHLVECTSCRVQHYAYHSCRHRACPTCMWEECEQWVKARLPELLPVPYFHIVLSVPNKLHGVIRAHKRDLYPVLMSAAARAIQHVVGNPRYLGGTTAVMAMLHTSARTLFYHPHVHCLVPAGAVDQDGQWRKARHPRLAPKRLLANAFHDALLPAMKAAVSDLQLPKGKLHSGWKVHVEQPKHGLDKVLMYLARSLFRGPMHHHRILDITPQDVRFDFPAHSGLTRRSLTLGGHEFLRRFLQHVWPDRIHKVRYFGLWSRKSRPMLEALRQQLQPAPQTQAPAPQVVEGPAEQPESTIPRWLRCPHCDGLRIIIAQFQPGTTPPPLRVTAPLRPLPLPRAQPP